MKKLYDDQKKYTVKETAKLTGIPEKTLRYYDDLGLFQPLNRNNDNNYRYYSIRQFYEVENYGFAKRMGIPLKQYREILIKEQEIQNSDISSTMRNWENVIKEKQKEIEALQEDIRLLHYFNTNARAAQFYLQTRNPYLVHLPEMPVFAIDHHPGEPFENTSIKTRTAIKQEPIREHVTYRFGVILDADLLRKGEHRITHQYNVLDYYIDDPHVLRIPEGDYITVICRAWIDEDMELMQEMAKKADPDFPFVFAEEFAPFENTDTIRHQVFFRVSCK